ncbi:MAG: leucine-rich repeat protein [Clostridia bacterium]|nr:leucine-rich repeat protein [Clostridia bacterium]
MQISCEHSIPDGVTSVGKCAFEWCASLTSVVIPKSVTSIGENAFSGCSSLASIVIPKGVTSIGDDVFSYCSSLANIVIPESVTSIGDRAFIGCGSLACIVIPESVTSIGYCAFSDCKKLVDANGFVIVRDTLYNYYGKKSHIDIPIGVAKIGGGAFSDRRTLTSIAIHEGVTSIGRGAFSSYKKLRIKLPINVGELLKEAVYESDTLRIDISDISALPAKLRLYAALCFAEDGGLTTDPRFESHTKYIKSNAEKLLTIALQNHSLLSLMCREKLIAAKDTDAYMNAVQDSDNTELKAMLLDYLQNNVTAKDKEKAVKQKEKQDDTVFERAVVRSNKIGIEGLNFVVTGGLNTFKSRAEFKIFLESKGAKLLSSVSAKADYLIMNDADSNSEKKKNAEALGIEVITEDQFNDKADRLFAIESNGTLSGYYGEHDTVVIPEGVTSIGDRAFSGCSTLASIVIPEGVTSIGRCAFSDCNKLTSIVIPEGVTSIGDFAFSDCSSLANIVIPESVTSIGNRAFSRCEKLAEENGFVIVRDTLYNYYGKELHVAIPIGVASIGDFAFNDCRSITSIVIPESVTSIGDLVFSDCRSLTSIVISDGVTSIGESAFSSCESLTSIAIPKSVTRIGEWAFSGCKKLTSIIIPKSVTRIGDLVFFGCDNLTIHAPAGSYAEKYAKKKYIPFVAE